MNNMRIALVQMQARTGDPTANANAIESFMRKATEQGAHLICLPEASLTGYDPTHAADIALDAESAEIRALFDLADDLGIGVCFGLFEREGGNLFIAQPLHAQGATLWHRKTYLGNKEQPFITPGQAIETLDVLGVRIGVQVCWETHFPELSATHHAQGAEVVLMPFASGASGQKRREAWMKYLPACAADNGFFVAACNALLDPAHTTSPTARGGGIVAFDSHGNLIAEHFSLDEHMLICDLGEPLPNN